MSRKGVFIPDITIEMFKKATLESVAEFLASGQMEDIEIPERPHGEWNMMPWIDPRNVYFMCSLCGYNTVNGKPNFCPNCGADMRKEGEAE